MKEPFAGYEAGDYQRETARRLREDGLQAAWGFPAVLRDMRRQSKVTPDEEAVLAVLGRVKARDQAGITREIEKRFGVVELGSSSLGKHRVSISFVRGGKEFRDALHSLIGKKLVEEREAGKYVRTVSGREIKFMPRDSREYPCQITVDFGEGADDTQSFPVPYLCGYRMSQEQAKEVGKILCQEGLEIFSGVAVSEFDSEGVLTITELMSENIKERYREL
jgi:hypothetical protein